MSHGIDIPEFISANDLKVIEVYLYSLSDNKDCGMASFTCVNDVVIDGYELMKPNSAALHLIN